MPTRRLIRSYLRAAAAERGTAALEALFSIALIIGTIFLIWMAAVLIYDQTILNSATELASQEALVIYDRDTYRGQPSAAALQEAQRVAQSVFQEASRNLLTDQFGNGAGASIVSVAFTCATDYGQPFSSGACNSYGNARVEHFAIRSSMDMPITLVTPLVDNSFSTAFQTLTAYGSSYSAGAPSTS